MLSLTQPYQPSPFAGSGRPAHRPFRGLLGVHSRCSPHTRHVTVFRDALVTRGFNRFVTSTVAPVASGWSISPGGTLTHWKAPPFHGAPTKRPLERSLEVPTESCWNSVRKFQFPLDSAPEPERAMEGSFNAASAWMRRVIAGHRMSRAQRRDVRAH